MRAPRRHRTLLVAIIAGALACILHGPACKGVGTHVYEGRLYVEARDCLGTTSALDAIEGDEPGSCRAVCLVQRRADAARAVYVSTTCPPYPFDFDSSGNDEACGRALAALARGDTCLSDGGTTKPDRSDAAASVDAPGPAAATP